MSVTYRLLSRDHAYEGKGHLDVVSVEAQHEDGRVHVTQEPIWGYGDSIAVLPFDRAAKTVLLVRQMRPAVFVRQGGTILEACAGGIEAADKSIELACRREAREELGVSLVELEAVGMVYINPARLEEHAHLFLASYVSGQQKPEGREQDEDEDIEVVEMSINELFALYQDGAIRCPRLMMLTQALMLRL